MNTSCHTTSQPEMSGWCNEPRCIVEPGEKNALWCENLNDDGIAYEAECDNCIEAEERNMSWGVCSDLNRPQLPGSGFNYDTAVLQSVLTMPVVDLFNEVS
jgi:hypothetical protein